MVAIFQHKIKWHFRAGDTFGFSMFAVRNFILSLAIPNAAVRRSMRPSCILQGPLFMLAITTKRSFQLLLRILPTTAVYISNFTVHVSDFRRLYHQFPPLAPPNHSPSASPQRLLLPPSLISRTMQMCKEPTRQS